MEIAFWLDGINLVVAALAGMTVLAAAHRGGCYWPCTTGHVLFAYLPAALVLAAARCPSMTLPLAAVLLLGGYPMLLFLCIDARSCETTAAALMTAVATMVVAATAGLWSCHYAIHRSRAKPPRGEDPPPPYEEEDLTGGSSSTLSGANIDPDTSSSPSGCH